MRICFAQNCRKPSSQRARPSTSRFLAFYLLLHLTFPALTQKVLTARPGVRTPEPVVVSARNGEHSRSWPDPVCIRQTGRSLHISMQLDTLFWMDHLAESDQVYPVLPGFVSTGWCVEPVRSCMIVSPVPWKPHPEIRRSEPEKVRAPAPISLPYDLSSSEVADLPPSISQGEVISFQSLGKMNGNFITALRITPLKVDQTRRYLFMIRQIEIKLTLPEGAELVPLRQLPALFSSFSAGKSRTDIRPDNRCETAPATGKGIPREYAEAAEIIVREDGVCRLTAKTLWDSIGTRLSIDPRTFRLFNRGKEQFLHVCSSGNSEFMREDYIEFITTPPGNLSRGDMSYRPNEFEVYYLVWGRSPGKRFTPVSAEPVCDNPHYLRSFREHLHLEEERYFDRLNHLNTGAISHRRDHWFHSSPIYAGVLEDFTFHLPHPDPATLNQMVLTVNLRGLSTGIAGNHQVQLYINSRYAGKTPLFHDKSVMIHRCDALPGEILRFGENRLQLAVDEIQSEYESVVLDWFSVDYDRLFMADRDYLPFSPPRHLIRGEIYEYTLERFLSPHIQMYCEDGSILRNVDILTELDTSFAVRLQVSPSTSDQAYHAVSDMGVLKPAGLRLISRDKDPLRYSEVNYLIITPEFYLNSAEEWGEYRGGMGWRTEVVTLEEIYREYSHGYPSISAIRELIREVYAQCSSDRMLHVLLLGDSHSSAEQSDRVFPIPYYQTLNYGAAETDYYFSNIDTTDLLPEVALGRIPVNSVMELEGVFEKIRRYEQNPVPGLWKNRFLYIAGYEPVFKQQSEELILYQTAEHIFPERLFIDFTGETGVFDGGTAELLEFFNNGVGYVNFMGHGGGAVWADRSLFLREDVQRMENGSMLPFITSMTCFTGSIEQERGLAEMLLGSSKGGAIGVFASSGLGWVWNDYLLVYDIPALLTVPDITLGEIINAARIGYLARIQGYGSEQLASTMVYQYNLLGDPAVRLVSAVKGDRIHTDSDRGEPGEQLILRTEKDAPTAVQIYSPDKIPLFREGQLTVDWQPDFHGGYWCTVPLSETLPQGQWYLTYFCESDDGHEWCGAIRLGLGVPLIDSLRVTPTLPFAGDSIYFLVRINSDTKPDSVVVHTTTHQGFRMVTEDGFIWRTVVPHLETYGGQEFEWWVVVNLPDGMKTVSRKEKVRIQKPGDLRFETAEVVHGHKPILRMIVYSEELLDYIPEHLSPVLMLTLRSNDGELLGTDSVKIDCRVTRYDTISLPFYTGSSRLTLRYHLDSEEMLREANERDNIGIRLLENRIYAVTPELGLTFDGRTSGELEFNNWCINILPGEVRTPCTIGAGEDILPFDEKRWQMAPLWQAGTGIRALNVQFSSLHHPRKICVNTDSQATDSTVWWYGWRESSPDEVWHRIASHTGLFEVKDSGVYSLFIPGDDQPPEVTFSVGEQSYLPGMYIGPDPVFRFTLHDNVGFDGRGDRFHLRVDGETIQEQDLSLDWTESHIRRLILEYRGHLTEGDHRIRFR